MQNNTAAIVVTYNRLAQLQRCMEQIGAQTVPCDILIIDNASTDGTEFWAKEAAANSDRIFYCNTGENLGGAGGFHFGMKEAYRLGYDYFWLMDDDCFPESDALEELFCADALLEGKYGWLSSVALWRDGKECQMNRQKLQKDFYTRIELLKNGLVKAQQATFVSLFLKAETVEEVGLPVKEFFIWGDDIEYTRRIAVRHKTESFVVGKSRVLHDMKNNCGSSIAVDDVERLPRYRLAYRNEAFTYRKEGFRGRCYYLAKCGLHTWRILTKARDHRFKRLSVLLRGMFDGIFFRPSIEIPKKRQKER